MTSLDGVIRLIHDKQCSFRVSDDVVKDIEDMVVHLVKNLLPKLLKCYPSCHFSVAEVVDAGSYFEQTKIELPNEFDFMLVVEQLSNVDSISLKKGCRDGYARVGVVNQELWDSAKPDDGPERRFEIAMLQFNMFVRETLKLLLSEPIKGRLGEFSMKDITVRGKPYKAFSHVQTLTLIWTKYSHVDIKHPSTKVKILYERQPKEELEICVDLMSCCHSSLSTFNNLLPTMSLKNELLKKNGCHIVLKSCESVKCVEKQTECRLISYTKTEQECMRRLHENWKTVYKVLKWLFHYTEILEVDTYKIKTAILYCSSRRRADSVSLGEGLIKVLYELRKSAYNNRLPGYFNSSLNVWNVSPSYQYLVKYEISFLLKLFSKMQSVSTDNENTYLQENLSVINMWLQSFCSHAAEIAEIKKDRLTGLECFNWQGNLFLEILKDLEPVLKSHSRFAWIPFQMKCCVLGDVFKILTVILVKKISRMWLALL